MRTWHSSSGWAGSPASSRSSAHRCPRSSSDCWGTSAPRSSRRPQPRSRTEAELSSYAFRAVDLAGVPSRGEVDAESKGQVSEQLRERGLIVLDVSEKNEAFRFEQIFD